MQNYMQLDHEILKEQGCLQRNSVLKSLTEVMKSWLMDPEVDIIYIASPHSHHYEHTMLCLKNKKAVICEKAFALNSREVDEMIKEAEKQGVFLMEALMASFPANLSERQKKFFWKENRGRYFI